MKACVISLGCPKNLTDSEVLMGKLSCSGYSMITDPKKADLIVVNTCAFLKASRKEALDTIREVNRNKKPGAKVYVAGCLPRLRKQKVEGRAWKAGVDGVIDSIDLFDSHTPRIKATSPWTAYVKISEGCDNRCSYCLIPKIRGPLRNRPVKDILIEVKQLARRGVKEIIFVAQDTTAHPRFAELLSRSAKVKGVHWIRVMYAHPAHLSDKVIKVMAKEKKVVKYLDLPIQHICDRILTKMVRKTNSSAIIGLIAKLRREIPNLVIRTSIIVGFPGETGGDFKKLADFVKIARFERLGVFRYSREEGTPAFKMRGQVPEKVKDERFHKLMNLQRRISGEWNKKMIGNTFEVLIESVKNGSARGRTYMDAPEIDGSVKINESRLTPGKVAKARITGASAYDLAASLDCS